MSAASGDKRRALGRGLESLLPSRPKPTVDIEASAAPAVAAPFGVTPLAVASFLRNHREAVPTPDRFDFTCGQAADACAHQAATSFGSGM